MNSLTPFSRPTFYTPGQNALSIGANLPSRSIVQTPSGPRFYTPKNLEGGNYLTNLKPKTMPHSGQNALTAIYNQDLGQSPGDTPSTGGDGNQGAGVSQAPGDMDTASLAAEIGQLDAFSDVMGTGEGLGFSFGPVTTLAGLYSAGKNKLNKEELQRRNDLMAPEDEVSPTEFSFDPNMSAQQIADQNREMQRGITGTDAGLDSRNDPTPAPTGNAADGQGSDTVICSELYRQGIMPRHIWEADERFGHTLDKSAREGYHRWARPWVRVMQRSPLATRLTWLVARPWAYHMAYQMKAVEVDSPTGRLIMKVGLPLCRLLGSKRPLVGKRYNPPAN